MNNKPGAGPCRQCDRRPALTPSCAAALSGRGVARLVRRLQASPAATQCVLVQAVQLETHAAGSLLCAERLLRLQQCACGVLQPTK